MVHPFPCAMMRWLEAREGMVSGCAEDDHCGPERGVVATRDLEADEEILRVPAALLLTAGSARACLGLPERMIALPEEDLIVLMILAESARGERSRWWSWIRSLPPFVNVPLVWPAAQQKALGSVLHERASRQRSEAAARYASLMASLDACEPLPWWRSGLSEDRYLWGLTILESRGKFLECEQLGAERWAVVPVGDLFNHAAEAEACVAARYDEPSQSYRYATTRAIPSGSPLCLCYGPHDDATLVQSYGFVLPHNPHARALVPEAVFASSLEPDDRAWLSAHGLDDDYAFDADGAPSWTLHSALRLKCASSDERAAGGRRRDANARLNSHGASTPRTALDR